MEGKEEKVTSWSKPRKEKPRKYSILIRKSFITLDEYRRVIWLRFGSLDNRDKIWHTPKEIKEITGVNYKTQYGMVKRWVERGHKIVSLLYLRGSRIKIDEATRSLIASPEQLMLQRHLSLETRSEYWQEMLGLEKLSSWLIRQIYLEHGATFRKPQCTYVAKQEREALLLQ
jgi:transposase